jgi:hypothetical protein
MASETLEDQTAVARASQAQELAFWMTAVDPAQRIGLCVHPILDSLQLSY